MRSLPSSARRTSPPPRNLKPLHGLRSAAAVSAAVIGGIVSSTLLTLFVLPALYSMVNKDDARPAYEGSDPRVRPLFGNFARKAPNASPRRRLESASVVKVDETRSHAHCAGAEQEVESRIALAVIEQKA